MQMKIVDDSRPFARRMVESFLNKFFPSGYPYRLVLLLPFKQQLCFFKRVMLFMKTAMISSIFG